MGVKKMWNLDPISVRISNYPVRVISLVGPDARTLGVKTLWMIPSGKWSEAEMVGNRPTFVWKETGKGTNPTTMARAQVQRLNWLNSLWKQIWKTTFHLLDASDTLNWAFPYPFSLLQRFLFKASWRVLVEDDCFQYLWPRSVTLICQV